MRTLLISLLALHVLPAFFWVGTTIVLAQTGAAAAEKFAYPQLGSATLSMLAGLALWGILHGAGFGTFEQVLALGVVCAVAAAGVQSAIGLPALRRLRGAEPSQAVELRSRIVKVQGVASGLLAITAICMVGARYV